MANFVSKFPKFRYHGNSFKWGMYWESGIHLLSNLSYFGLLQNKQQEKLCYHSDAAVNSDSVYRVGQKK